MRTGLLELEDMSGLGPGEDASASATRYSSLHVSGVWELDSLQHWVQARVVKLKVAILGTAAISHLKTLHAESTVALNRGRSELLLNEGDEAAAGGTKRIQRDCHLVCVWVRLEGEGKTESDQHEGRVANSCAIGM